MNFLHGCWQDEDRTDTFMTSTLGLIGDFGDTFKTDVKSELLQDWVQIAITDARSRGSSKQTRTNAAYAAKVSMSQRDICAG